MSITHGVPDDALRHGVLDECYSGIPRTSVGCLVLGNGSPSIPRLYTLHLTLYALHPTPYTGVPTICHVHGGGSPCLPCFRVNPCSSVGGTSPCHLLCFASGLAIFSPLSFRSRGSLVLVIPITSKSLPLHFTPYTKNNH